MFQQEGQGWRLAFDLSKGFFPILIGGRDWAIEISQYEWKSLFSFVIELNKQYLDLKNHLMPHETFCIEMEKDIWWGCIEGDKETWSLRLILDGKGEMIRGVEFFWPSPAAQEIATAMRLMWDSHK